VTGTDPAAGTRPLWGVEVANWDELGPGRRRMVLAIAGDLGAEWWGGGRLQFGGSRAAFQCVDEGRQYGFTFRLVLRRDL
jgi:hypothetical protein